jgi:plasmid maintenance system killer protein
VAVNEHRDIEKICRKLPQAIVEKYETWKEVVLVDGPDKLKEYPGLRDEKLKGERGGQRSSRLNLQYRVIYSVERDVVTVYVLEITPHKY